MAICLAESLFRECETEHSGRLFHQLRIAIVARERRPGSTDPGRNKGEEGEARFVAGEIGQGEGLMKRKVRGGERADPWWKGAGVMRRPIRDRNHEERDLLSDACLHAGDGRLAEIGVCHRPFERIVGHTFPTRAAARGVIPRSGNS